MSYVWGNEGPSFEYPTCYRTENRFLTLRAATLFLVALALLWIALSDPEQAQSGAALLRAKVDRGSWVPHLVMSLLLFALGAIDLVRVSRQRHVRLAEGQPAPLASDLSFHVTGASSGAAWLHRAVTTGRVDTPELVGSYRRVFGLIARHVARYPVALQTYMGVRVSQIFFSAGLLLALVALWAVAPQRPGLPVAAVLFGLLAVAHAVYTEWIAERAPSPLAVAAVLVLAVAAGTGITLMPATMPQLAALKSWALPASGMLLLGCLLLSDGLGLLAARGQVEAAARRDVAQAEAVDDVQVDVQRLMRELDSELVRRWVDGVPNRRFIRRLPQEARGEAVAASVVVLEETQPTLPGKQRDQLQPLPMSSRIWLLMLAVVGLVLTALGGVTWAAMGHALMEDGASGWTRAVPAVVLILAGGYALRVGHLLWSRIEVESSVLMLSVDASLAGTPESPETLCLRVRVVKVVSMFYAAAEHTLGSRRILSLLGDAASAKAFVDRVQSFTRRGPVAQPAPAKAARQSAEAAAVATAAPVRGMARFCPACGTPVLQGARFCPELRQRAGGGIGAVLASPVACFRLG